MQTQTNGITYDDMVRIAQANEGERGRIVYSNGPGRSGVIRTKDYGHCVDVMLDSYGGFFYGTVVAFQVMRNGRYVDVS